MARPFLLQTRWVVGHLIILVMVVGMIALGFWQIDRLHERKAQNRLASAAMQATPVNGMPTLFTPNWTNVRLAGTWQADGTRLVRYPLHDGAPGYYVVTPFHVAGTGLGEGDILINRGWISVDRGKPLTAAQVITPAGFVTVDGLFRKAQRMSGTPGVNEGRPPLTTVTAITEPWVQATSRDDPLGTTPLDGPDLSEGSHFSYALQWWSFCLIAIFGWAALLWHASRDPNSTNPS